MRWILRVEPISHRGFWLAPDEQNTEIAFRRSLQAGFGIETDLQFRDGEIVIAHDVAQPAHMTLEAFFDLYNRCETRPALALNIKADGLQDHLARLLDQFEIDNYFVFDMSVPELLRYRARKTRYFTRISEYETEAVGIEEADGVWLDQFHDDWVGPATIERWSKGGKRLCMVSPELHRRDPAQAWAAYRDIPDAVAQTPILLCTDLPSRARDFFS